jgi:hypothetical protein
VGAAVKKFPPAKRGFIELPDGSLLYRGKAADPNAVERLVLAGPKLRSGRLAKAVRRFVDEVTGDLIRAERADAIRAIKKAWRTEAHRRPTRVWTRREIISYYDILRGRGCSVNESVKKCARDFKVSERHVRQLVSIESRRRSKLERSQSRE